MGSFDMLIGMMVALGILIGLAVLYTSALISFEELKRELSVMLMLGLIGEYVGRMYICLNHAPQFVVREIVGGEEEEAGN